MPSPPQFRYAAGYRAKVPAEVAGAELVRLAAGRGLDGLPVREVVEAAKREDSPIHDVFEWDDKQAGEAHRFEQARALVRNVLVIVRHADADPTSHKVFVNLRDGGGYRRVVEVKKDDEAYARLVALALADLRSAKARLADVRGLGDVVRQIAAIERLILRKQAAA
jgi:hypothetical protein